MVALISLKSTSHNVGEMREEDDHHNEWTPPENTVNSTDREIITKINQKPSNGKKKYKKNSFFHIVS